MMTSNQATFDCRPGFNDCPFAHYRVFQRHPVKIEINKKIPTIINFKNILFLYGNIIHNDAVEGPAKTVHFSICPDNAVFEGSFFVQFTVLPYNTPIINLI